MYRTILVPLDGSGVSEQALPHAVNLARGQDAELWLLRVVEPWEPVVVDRDALGYQRGDVLETERGLAEAYLEGCREHLTEQGIPVKAFLKIGPVAATLMEFAEEHRPDLIVVSSHGRSGISRWACGSVAEKVLRHAPCAVMVIRAARSDQSAPTDQPEFETVSV